MLKPKNTDYRYYYAKSLTELAPTYDVQKKLYEFVQDKYDDGAYIIANEQVHEWKQEILEEYVMLGLRTKYGIDLDYIKKEFKVDLLKEKKSTINSFIENKFINLVYNRIIATDLGVTVLNKIILDLLS